MDHIDEAMGSLNKIYDEENKNTEMEAFIIWIEKKQLNESILAERVVRSVTESTLASKISENIRKARSCEDGRIDFKALQNDLVPIISDVDVFISFCHDDEEAAFELCDRLEGHCKPFIDPLFWGSIDARLKEYDDEFSLAGEEENGLYSYIKRNKSTAVFHAMLADSLKRTIQNCRYFVFLASKNSMDEANTTISPWIYLENSYCQDRLPNRGAINENWDGKNGLFKMPLNFDGFEPITEQELIERLDKKLNAAETRSNRTLNE